MANYSLVTSEYKPWSLDELVAPILLYNKAYDEIQDKLIALQDEANPFDKLTTDADGKIHTIATTYNKTLNDFADLFAKEGFIGTNAKARAQQLRLQFNSNIVPIKLAADRRSKDIAAYIEANMKSNGTLLSNDNPMNLSLEKYYDNPNYSALGQVVSGKSILEEAFQLASTLKGKLLQGLPSRGKNIDAFHYLLLTKYGVSEEDIRRFIMNPNDPNNLPVLGAIVDSVIAPIKSWGNSEVIEAARLYATKGLWGALGQDKLDVITDEAAKMNYQATLQERAAIRAAARAKKLAELDRANTHVDPTFKERNPITQKEVDTVNGWNNYRKYFRRNKDGHYYMTQEGKNLFKSLGGMFLKYNNMNKMFGGTDYSTNPQLAYSITKGAPGLGFFNFVLGNGLIGLVSGKWGKWQLSKINNLEHKYLGLTDMTKYTEKIRDLDTDLFEDVLGILNRAAENGELHDYTLINNKGNYSLTRSNSTKNISNISAKDVNSMTVVYGASTEPYLEISLKDGSKGRIPFSVFDPSRAKLVADLFVNVNKYDNALKSGKTHIMVDGIPFRIVDLKNKLLNDIGDNLVSALGTVKSKPNEVVLGVYDLMLQ